MYDEISKTEAKDFLTSDLNTYLDCIKYLNQNKQNNQITYSKNIFLPLSYICQNNCGYCTFKKDVNETEVLVMNPDDVFDIVKNGKENGCTEALFTFGESADKIMEVQQVLNNFGFESMVDYVYYLSNEILNKHEMLPHTNMGILSRNELRYLSEVNASMGLMLETTNKKLMKTIVHKDSPGKNPEKRLNHIKNAGKEKIPFTTGLLIGIGETVEDRVDSLFAIRKLQDKYNHIQEIIIQNFTPKADIPMAKHPKPSVIELLKLTLLASKMFPDVSIQIPPNLNKDLLTFFILCGADDFGGISPITKDFVNPEKEWPKITEIKTSIKPINYTLKERLPVYDKFINNEYLKENVYEKTSKLKKEIS